MPRRWVGQSMLHYIIDTLCAVLVIENTIEECLMLLDGKKITRQYCANSELCIRLIRFSLH